MQLKILLARPIQQNLLWLQVTQQLLHVVVSALTRQELARRDVEERNATRRLPKMHSAKKIVFFVVQHVVRQRHTRRHQFRDATLHEFLRQLGVFQLVADGHTLACTDEFRQIGIECMMGKARHLVALVVTVVTMGQRDAQNPRSGDSVLAISLVKVATTEKHHRIGMLRLQVEELFHHRGQFLALWSTAVTTRGC